MTFGVSKNCCFPLLELAPSKVQLGENASRLFTVDLRTLGFEGFESFKLEHGENVSCFWAETI